MLASVHVNHLEHQRTHGAAIKAGLERRGIHVEYAGYDEPVPDVDFAVIWGAPGRHPRVSRASRRLLVMERGHLGDRMAWTSIGWNGLGHHGIYPVVDDGGKRWRDDHANRMRLWKPCGIYALILGQVPGDAAVGNLDIRKWANDVRDELIHGGWRRVVYRPHPKLADGWYPRGSELSRASLEEDLNGAALAVTYNSTSGVDAVLAGVPTITMNYGAMAWPVTSHDVRDPVITPDREPWAHALAWTQWTMEEIEFGIAWEYLSRCMPPTAQEIMAKEAREAAHG